jgi:hypothetical protein
MNRPVSQWIPDIQLPIDHSLRIQTNKAEHSGKKQKKSAIFSKTGSKFRDRKPRFKNQIISFVQKQIIFESKPKALGKSAGNHPRVAFADEAHVRYALRTILYGGLVPSEGDLST